MNSPLVRLHIGFCVLMLILLNSSQVVAQLVWWQPGQSHVLVPDPDRALIHFSGGMSATDERMLHQSGISGSQTFNLGNRGLAMLEGKAMRSLNHILAQTNSRSEGPIQSFPGYLLDGNPVWLSNRLLLEVKAGVDPEEIQILLGEGKQGTTPGGITYAEYPTAEEALMISQELVKGSWVEWAHPDMWVQSQKHSLNNAPRCEPNDPYWNLQYYAHNEGNYSFFIYPYMRSLEDLDVDAPEAWCITKGSSDLIVAVIDEGVEAHEDLEDDATGESRVLNGYSAVEPTNTTGAPFTNDAAHGQAVSGIIAASHNDLGVAGIAPEVKVLPIHVYIDPPSLASEFADAIQYAWQNGADVINNSWTLVSCFDAGTFPVLEDAIEDARTYGRNGKGCIVNFATGNREALITETCLSYPANLPTTFTAGGISPTGTLPGWAKYGSELDVVVPSNPDNISNVFVMDRMGNLGFNNDAITYEESSNTNYSRYFGGSSVACATVSGIAALVLATNPNLTVSEVESILRSSATDVGSTGRDDFFGYGIVNAYEAVQAALAVLPVEWGKVEASLIQSDVEVSWSTFSEIHVQHFEVERWNGQQFHAIGEIPAQGTASSYRFADHNPPLGNAIYRIKSVDIDGSYSYSEVVEVKIGRIGAPVWIESPIQDALYIHLTGGDFSALQILDVQGRILHDWKGELHVQDELISWPVSNMPAGHYFLKFRQHGLEEVVKFVKY
ncbi:S8 family serine peptidase [Pontibacter sp. G13]|uniref:S8 family serine peptidase n=1 Tax=Pontibacter sp. G13 TaxID=3074898 RepID=UPI002889BA28|nr:S8 family serine peptidase [Pontibacter sp. G13]WNJ16555.1 S8 family serine peptidase [Pontibacter sp. G13]